MAEVATSGGPLAIGVCFGAYSCCWFAVVGFLPTLQVERLHFTPETAAIVTTIVAIVNIGGNLARRLAAAAAACRAWSSSSAATVSMAVCAVGDLPRRRAGSCMRLVLAGVYSAVIGVVPGCLFTAIPVHAPRPQLVGAATGLLMQVSNFGALIGPPITAALVSAGGWPAAAWMTASHWGSRRWPVSSCTGAKGVGSGA